MDPYADIPELSAEAQALARRRKIAEAMMAQSQQPLESMGQAGGAPVPISWTQGLAKMAQAYFAGQQGKDIEQADKGLAERRNQMEADAVKAYSQRLAGTPEQVNALPPDQAGPPQITPAVPATPDQRRQAIIDAMAQSKFPRLAATAGAQQRYDEADTARTMQMDQRRWEVEQRGQDKLDQIELQAREGRISRAEADQRAREAKQDMIRLTAAMRAQPQATGGKPPTGYRYLPDGNLEPIPGGPKDMTLKNKALSDTAKVKSGVISENVDRALDQMGFFSTGFLGEVTGGIPGTPGYNLESTLDTIKANIGFNELQAMRQASPTGGALGQVAVRELDMLQAVLGSLKKGQDPDILKKNLEAVKSHYTNWKKAVDASAEQEGGGVVPGSPPSDGPPPGAVRLKR